jgi:hypothetical protein
MKNLFSTFLAILISFSLHSQNRFDVFNIAGNYNFMESADNEINKNYESAITANFSVPIVLKDSSVWYTSIDYQNFVIDQEFTENPAIEKFYLHGFILRTGYIYRFNPKQSLQVLIAPRFMTDFNASFSESLQLGGIIMYENVKSKDLTYRIGAFYNQDFFGPYLVPVVYLDWNMTSTLKLKGLLPVYGKIFMEPSDKIDVGLHFIGLTTSYRINEPPFEDFYVERKSIDVSAFTNIHLFDNVFLEARVGYSLLRDYGLYDENDKVDFGLPLYNFGDDRERLNEEAGGSPFIHVRLIYSVPIE